MNCVLSAAWPAVSTNASGRHLRLAARWTLLVCPSLKRPRRAAFSRSFRRRRMRRRSSRAGSSSASCPLCSSSPSLLTWPSPLGGCFLQGGDDVLVKVHPGRVVVDPGGGGVDADQGQVHLTPLRGFRDQAALQQGLEDPGVPPLPEAVVDGRPGAEIRRHLPPLPARLEPPDHALELLPQSLGVRAVLADRQVRLDELPCGIGQLYARRSRAQSHRDAIAGGSPDPRVRGETSSPSAGRGVSRRRSGLLSRPG